MAAIMKAVTSIGKDRKNIQQNFSFRGIDDVMNELHGIFAENEVFITTEIMTHTVTERQTKSGGVMLHVICNCKFRIFTVDGSNVEIITVGEAMDSGDKATNKAMSVALKYALLQAFLIPTEDEKDPDAKTPEQLTPNTTSEPKTPEQKQGRPWLNPNTEQWEKAIEYLKSGGTIDEIMKKYFISSKNKETLIQNTK